MDLSFVTDFFQILRFPKITVHEFAGTNRKSDRFTFANVTSPTNRWYRLLGHCDFLQLTCCRAKLYPWSIEYYDDMKSFLECFWLFSQTQSFLVPYAFVFQWMKSNLTILLFVATLIRDVVMCMANYPKFIFPPYRSLSHSALRYGPRIFLR